MACKKVLAFPCSSLQLGHRKLPITSLVLRKPGEQSEDPLGQVGLFSPQGFLIGKGASSQLACQGWQCAGARSGVGGPFPPLGFSGWEGGLRPGGRVGGGGGWGRGGGGGGTGMHILESHPPLLLHCSLSCSELLFLHLQNGNDRTQLMRCGCEDWVSLRTEPPHTPLFGYAVISPVR